MKNFILIGAAGYIAPRHMKAIKETGNNLIAALDPHDAVGILDQYFPECDFFTEFERFDRHCEKLRRSGTPIHYVSVCSPNYLHDAHCRFGLRIGADVICEKPVVLNPWNVDALAEIEKETEKKIFSILQLRHHPEVIALRNRILHQPAGKKNIVDLKYITPRGNWYHSSWKGDIYKSGGITTNIGIHFFDLLLWIFGDAKTNEVYQHDNLSASGKLIFNNAEISWYLSIDEKQMPVKTVQSNTRAYRFFNIDGETIDLNDGFADLHTQAYCEIMAGKGLGLADAKKVIQLLFDIRNKTSILPGI